MARPSGRSAEGGVDLADVALVLVLAVAALAGDHLPLMGVVQVGEAGVVQLEVAAPERGEGLDLRGVRRAEVVPELVEVRVDPGIDGGPPAAVVDHARRGDGELGQRGRDGGRQELEGVREDRVLEPHLPVDPERRGRELDGALGVLELDDQVLLGPADAPELVDEVHVPRSATELSVRGGLESDVLLHPDDGADGLVLDRSQLVRRDVASGRVLASPAHGRRSQQASHVIGPEGG